MYLDNNGLIVQQNGDGGDCSQRMGMWWGAVGIRKLLSLPPYPSIPNLATFPTTLSLLIVNGCLIRYPSPPYNDPKDTSRDQTLPMIMACGFSDDKKPLEYLIPKNGLVYQNGDLQSPADWNTLERAQGGIHNNAVGDGFLLGGAMIRCHQASSNPDDVGDDLNTLYGLVFNYVLEKSSLAAAALGYYLRNRPTNFGVSQLGEPDPVIGALVWYFRPETGGNPECADIWRDIVSKLRSDLPAAL